MARASQPNCPLNLPSQGRRPSHLVSRHGCKAEEGAQEQGHFRHHHGCSGPLDTPVPNEVCSVGLVSQAVAERSLSLMPVRSTCPRLADLPQELIGAWLPTHLLSSPSCVCGALCPVASHPVGSGQKAFCPRAACAVSPSRQGSSTSHHLCPRNVFCPNGVRAAFPFLSSPSTGSTLTQRRLG